MSVLLGGLMLTGRRIGPPQEVEIRKSDFRLLIYSTTSSVTPMVPEIGYAPGRIGMLCSSACAGWNEKGDEIYPVPTILSTVSMYFAFNE